MVSLTVNVAGLECNVEFYSQRNAAHVYAPQYIGSYSQDKEKRTVFAPLSRSPGLPAILKSTLDVLIPALMRANL